MGNKHPLLVYYFNDKIFNITPLRSTTYTVIIVFFVTKIPIHTIHNDQHCVKGKNVKKKKNTKTHFADTKRNE